MELKDILRNKRKELNLTMKQVADACGVSEATVSRWESGDIGDMKRSRIAALAKVLHISPAIIVGFDANEDIFHYGDHRANLDYFSDKHELLETYKHVTEDNNLKLLFDSTKDLSPQDLEPVLLLIDAIRKNKGLK